MNFIAMGLFLKKDIALIWNKNELPSHKGSWETEKNSCYLQHSYSCAVSWKVGAVGATKAALRQDNLN